MLATSDTESGIRIPGTSSHFIDPTGDRGEGRLRYVTGGTGAPLMGLLHWRRVAPAGEGCRPFGRNDFRPM